MDRRRGLWLAFDREATGIHEDLAEAQAAWRDYGRAIQSANRRMDRLYTLKRQLVQGGDGWPDEAA